MDTMVRSDVRHEQLRIAGKKVETANRLEVRFPWDNRLVGTVPRATPGLVAEAFAIARTRIGRVASLSRIRSRLFRIGFFALNPRKRQLKHAAGATDSRRVIGELRAAAAALADFVGRIHPGSRFPIQENAGIVADLLVANSFGLLCSLPRS